MKPLHEQLTFLLPTPTECHIRVEPIPKREAEAIIRAGHYSGSVVWSSCIHLGVFFGRRRIGALQFGPGMNPASGGKVVRDTKPGEWLELNRMWLDDDKPPNTATQAISQAVAHIRRARPEVQWVQSFADERCGKRGAVYQAASFLYLGSHRTTFYRLDGEWFHKSLLNRPPVDKRGWGSGPKAARFAAGKDRAEAFVFEQYRYLRPLRRDVMRRLLLPVLPYPKQNAAAPR